MDIEKNDLAAKAALLYYEQNCNQNEVAEQLNISRSYVSQLLSYAKDIGVVNISVRLDAFSLRSLKQEIFFQKRWPGLKRVYIMDSQSSAFSSSNLGKFAAPFVADSISFSSCIGINPGVSVERTVSQLIYQTIAQSSDKQVVQMMGGFQMGTSQDSAQPNEIAKQLGSVLGCDVHYLNCPAFIQQKRLYSQLIRERSIASVIEMWEDIDLAIMGLGVADERSKLCQMFDTAQMNLVRESGACGMLNTTFFDGEGNLLDLFENQKIGIHLDALHKAQKLVICSDQYKAAALRAALKGNFIDILITDLITVEAVNALDDTIKENG